MSQDRQETEESNAGGDAAETDQNPGVALGESLEIDLGEHLLDVDPPDDQGFEPASTEASPSQAHQRSVIKPKLIKRNVGVRLTEVRRSGRAQGARAPRGAGPLVEGDASASLRRDRALKRAAELISYVSEDLAESVFDSDQGSSPSGQSADAARASLSVPPQSESSPPPSKWNRWSIIPKSMRPREVKDEAPQALETTDETIKEATTSPHASWALDEETLSAITPSSDVDSLEPLSAPLQAGSEVTRVDDESDPMDGLIPEGAFSDQPPQSSPLTPQLFTEQLRLFPEESEPLRANSSGAQGSSNDWLGDRAPTQEISRGEIIWSSYKHSHRSTSLSPESHNSARSSSERRGWRLERLQNRVEGAETWVGREIDREADDDASQRDAVLKVVWPQVLSDNPMMWQFDAEIQVRALQQIDHVAVPHILDWGEDPERSTWFTALEWVEGDSLAHRLKRNALTVDDAVSLFSKLAEGLALCHREGIIHRKIQPAHIILSPRGPSFISFQWVDEIGGQDLQRAQQGAYQLFGRRPKFLAPEWMQDAMITDAADVYALGACLLEAVAPDATTWRDAPPLLHACLAGALHHHPDERSDIYAFIKDLELSSAHYLYQAGSDPSLPTQELPLHEVVKLIRKSELGWHLLGRRTDDESGFSELIPWGDCPEVVTALERAKRYQVEPKHVEPAEASEDLALRRDELDQRASKLADQERSLRRLEEELKWRDEAMRERERELNERDASLQEEANRLEKLSADLDAAEEALKVRRAGLEESEGELDELRAQLTTRADELEARSASLRVEESEIARREAERAEEIELLRVSLESERQRLLADERAEKESELTRIQEQARLLIEKREEARRAAVIAEEEAREAKRRRAAEEAAADREREAEREAFAQELEERTSQRHAREDAEGAFARVELRRAKTAESAPPPDELTHREFEIDGATLRARYCPPGSTWCGSDDEGARAEERPRHRAQITRGFWLMETPVTQAQWSTLMEDNPSSTVGLDHPVEGVTWVEAALFCNAMSEMFELEPAYEFDGDINFSRNRTRVHWRYRAAGFRLPTELEWEYAARSGLSGQRHLYPLGGDLAEVGWFSQNASGSTHPVGLKAPNAWGLYDLSGNVWEWCHDEWRRESYRQRAQDGARDAVAYNPQLTPRVIRGGAWYDFQSTCRIAARPGQDVNQSYGIGLRLCLPHRD